MLRDNISDDIKKAIKKANMIVIRYSNNQLTNSKPCNQCTDILKKLELKYIYYSNNNVIIKEKVKFLETEHKSQLNRTFYKKYK